MQTPSIGRVVLYALSDPHPTSSDFAIVERPAEIVAVFPGEFVTHVNLHVKLDGTNDSKLLGVSSEDVARMALWATSITPADDQEVPQLGRYRWPPRVK